MPSSDNEGSRRISVDLPNDLITRFDQLKQEWGLRRRGAVLERLLETIFEEQDHHQEDNLSLASISVTTPNTEDKIDENT